MKQIKPFWILIVEQCGLEETKRFFIRWHYALEVSSGSDGLYCYSGTRSSGFVPEVFSDASKGYKITLK